VAVHIRFRVFWASHRVDLVKITDVSEELACSLFFKGRKKRKKYEVGGEFFRNIGYVYHIDRVISSEQMAG
jgi:hypothetical protein